MPSDFVCLPAREQSIVQRYNIHSLEKKSDNKIALQRELGWPDEPRRPIVCLPMGMSQALGGELFKQVLPGLLTLPIEILVLGKGSEDFGVLFTNLKNEENHRLHIMADTQEEQRKMYAASDIALFLIDPSQMPELTLSMAFGAIPIAPHSKQLENYDPIQERGTAFTFAGQTGWHVFASLVRALETYKFPFDWRTIQKQTMAAVKTEL